MAKFDFKELAARAHIDYVGPKFPVWFLKNKDRFRLPDLFDVSSDLLNGGKYFMTLKLSYKGEEFLLPNEPLISISSSKTIVETPTVGKDRKGSVNEYITTDDDMITIRGVCINTDDPDAYPSKQVDELNKIFNINDSIEVVGNKFFELFGVRNIIIRTREIEEMVGEQSLQKYTLTAKSDQDFYADLNEQQKLLG